VDAAVILDQEKHVSTVTIACPGCGQGQIALQLNLLLQGTSFACGQCHAALAMTNQDSTTVLAKGLHALDQLKAGTTGAVR
jgi:ribosomal protein S27AE